MHLEMLLLLEFAGGAAIAVSAASCQVVNPTIGVVLSHCLAMGTVSVEVETTGDCWQLCCSNVGLRSTELFAKPGLSWLRLLFT